MFIFGNIPNLMKLLSYRFQNTDRAALWVGGQAYDVASLEAPLGPDMAGLLEDWDAASKALRSLEQDLISGALQATPLTLSPEDWLSPVPKPKPKPRHCRQSKLSEMKFNRQSLMLPITGTRWIESFLRGYQR